MKNPITVQLDEKTIELKKLPIGSYVDLIKAIKKFPKQIEQLDQINTESLISIIPNLLEESMPNAIALISVMVQMPEDEVKTLGLHEIIRLMEGFFKVNRFDEIYETIKKALTHPAIEKYYKVGIEPKLIENETPPKN